MIRPLTIVTFLMASGSGLYLYQSKHDAQVLDKTIERTVHETSALRDQSRLLVAEWTMLNDPGRLRQFSDTYLAIKPIAPGQYTSLADLDTRLPAPRVAPPHVEEVPAAVPVAAEPAAATDDDPDAAAVAEEELPVPPIPAVPHAVAIAVPHPVEHPVERVAERPAPAPKPPEVTPPHMLATATPRPPEQRAARPAETRVAEARPTELHPTSPPPQRPNQVVAMASRPVQGPVVAMASRPVQAPVVAMASRPAPPAPAPATVATATPYGGSLLGMARGSMQPAPRPMPVSSTQWSNTN